MLSDENRLRLSLTFSHVNILVGSQCTSDFGYFPVPVLSTIRLYIQHANT